MPKVLTARSLRLTSEDWAALEALAADLGTCPPCGTNAGNPSWRSLVKEIARGLVAVSRPPEPEGREPVD